MSEKLVPSIAPDLPNPAPLGPLSGNWHDDDAAVYEADFASATEGPQETAGVPHAKDELAPTTRLLSNKATVGTTNAVLSDPVMLLPADRNRKNLSIQVLGTTGELVVIAGSRSGCFNTPNWQAAATGAILSMDGHTGALWVYSTSAQSIVVTAMAVTV